MKKGLKRTPKGYEGTRLTTHQLSEILPIVLKNIEESYKGGLEGLLEAWPKLVGKPIAEVTRLDGIKDGLLFVRVTSTIMYSVLVQEKKPELLKLLQQHFPEMNLKKIIFKTA